MAHNGNQEPNVRVKNQNVLAKQEREKARNAADLVCKFMCNNSGIRQTLAINLIPPGVFPPV
jgi:hypothetical protein